MKRCVIAFNALCFRFLVLLGAVVLFGISANAQSYPAPWPSSGSWIGYTQLGVTTQDLSTANGDQTTGGTGVNPSSSDVFNGTSGDLGSAYYAYDAAAQVLFFRMRLRGDPRASGGGAPLVNGTWDSLIDTDGDGFKEFFIEVNGNDDVIYVYYGDVNQQDIPNGSSCASNGQGTVFSIAITLGTHVLVTDSTGTGGGYLIDYQVPLSAFKNCNNVQIITPTTPFSLAFSTSATTQNPTQKDFVSPGDFTMSTGGPMPMGDTITLTGPPDQRPRISGYTQTCGGGVNSSPVALTITTLDTLGVTGSGASATVIDTIASVTFSYRQDGSSTWVQINTPVTTPVVGTVNKWTTSWNTSALATGIYWIRIEVVDDQGNATTDFSHGIDLSNCSSPTYVDLVTFTAMGCPDGVTVIEWRTGYESKNLGFNVYREVNGNRVKLTSSLIAGSALKLAPTVTAGLSYIWRDTQSHESAAYWLEDVDLNGYSSWHGPVKALGGKSAAAAYEPNSRLLGDLGAYQKAEASTPVVERAAAISRASAIGKQLSVTGPAIKITVNREGWYRVNADQLIAAGLGPKSNPQLLQLYVDGGEQPINVNVNKDGSLSGIEFYGTGIDSPYTRERTYRLVIGSTPGKRITQLSTPSNGILGGSHLAKVERRDRTVYFPGLRNGERENFFGALIGHDTVEQTLTLSQVNSTASSLASLEIAIQGVTNQDHKVKVEINGTYAGIVSFFGQSSGVGRFNVPHSLLRDGTNAVRLSVSGGPGDISLVDYLRLNYQHYDTAEGNQLRLTATGGQPLTIDGFSVSSIRVLDITNGNAVQELIGAVEQRAGGTGVSLFVPGTGERTLLARSGDLARPLSVVKDVPSSWRQTSNGADLLIITRREFGPALDPLVALRRQQGLSVAVADIQDVYDEFAFGQKTPQAIKDLLQYATTSWKKKPRFVLLAGDASFDPNNYFGFGDTDLVPTKLIDTQFMETASDDWLADFNDDGLPELAIGRLPARTANEAMVVASKIAGYNNQQPADALLLVSDSNDTYSFSEANERLRELIPSDVRAQSLHRSDVDDQTLRALLFEAINSNQRLVNYVGHGSVDLWRGGVLRNADVDLLANGDQLTMFMMMTCLNGYYIDPSLEGLGEKLLKSERGAAVAVWASSGMTTPEGQALMNREAYRQLFSGQSLTIGEIIRRAKSAVADNDVRRTWILFGDPTMRLH